MTPDFAPWHRRAAAAILDSLVVAAGSAAILALAGQSPLWSRHGDYGTRWLLALVLTIAYYVPLMVTTNGQTLGKIVLRVRVVRTDRKVMSIARSAWREGILKQVVFNLPFSAPGGVAFGVLVLAVLDVLWPLWDRENRAFHDMLAKTRVRLAGGVVTVSPSPERSRGGPV